MQPVLTFREMLPSYRSAKVFSLKFPAIQYIWMLKHGEYYYVLFMDFFSPPSQVLEEPGEDSSRFDSVVPTVVKPPPSSSHLYQSEEPVELGILRQFTFSSELQVNYPLLLHA